jgi:hypothetical protein
MPTSARSPATGVPAAEPSGAVGTVSGNYVLRQEIIRHLESHHDMTIASCQKNVSWASAVFMPVIDWNSIYSQNPLLAME